MTIDGSMNLEDMEPGELEEILGQVPPERLKELLGATAEQLLAGDPEALKRVLDSVVRVPSPLIPWQAALSFNHCLDQKSTERRTLMAYPQSIFRGEGLWLWGVDDTTLVYNIKVGNQTCYEISGAPMPGRFFESSLTFAEFEKLLDPPKGGWQMQKLRELPPIPSRQRIRMRTGEIGNSISLDVEGPITHAVMWGLTIH